MAVQPLRKVVRHKTAIALFAGALAFQAVSGAEAWPTREAAPTRTVSQNKQSPAEQKVPGATISARLEQALRQALDLVPRIEDNEQKVQLLVAVARVQIKAGNAKAAAATLRQAADIAEAIEENTPQLMAL